MRIALLGAESTGKSELTRALCARLQQSGLTVHRVDEYLREWCHTHQRTPRADEQQHIANTQIERVGAAPANAVVIADTTPLMTAVYSQLIFDDDSLFEMALSHQASYDVTLLMGLDLPWTHDGFQRDGPHVREPVDTALRQSLGLAGLPFQVVYGVDAQRLENAFFCIGQQVPKWAKQLARPEPTVRWTGPCDTCGDGDCEHRLFTQLIKN
jgi:nicotinamide riboside kinase